MFTNTPISFQFLLDAKHIYKCPHIRLPVIQDNKYLSRKNECNVKHFFCCLKLKISTFADHISQERFIYFFGWFQLFSASSFFLKFFIASPLIATLFLVLFWVNMCLSLFSKIKYRIQLLFDVGENLIIIENINFVW